jgi:hypothetical protein
MRSPNGSIHTTQTPLPCHFTIPLSRALNYTLIMTPSFSIPDVTHSGVSCGKKYCTKIGTLPLSDQAKLHFRLSSQLTHLHYCRLYGDSRIFPSPMYCILQSFYKTNEFPSVNENIGTTTINDHICSFLQK